VLGRHVDRLKFLEVMLGDQPALTPPELIYQRMLAGDPVEASEQARLFLREKPLIAYYDEILLEGIKLAQVDAERNRLDEDSMRRIRDAVAEIVDDLDTEKEDTERKKGDTERKEDAKAAEQSPLAQLEKLEAASEAQPLPARWRTGKPVLCVPGAGLLDEAVAVVIAKLVERRGIGARAEQADALSMARIFNLDTTGVALVCLCFIEYATTAQVRYAVRRVRRLAPDVVVLVALLNDSGGGEEAQDGMDVVRGSFRATIDKLVAIASDDAVPDKLPDRAIRTDSNDPLRSAVGSTAEGSTVRLSGRGV
jgi:hypothetical protein